ncbi:TRAP transporter large permease [Paracoccus jeotgali]|uniref:TRAP transporter large permease n=1 Tax=Paracoccus jeotgali TaxID=2065379 RepID=UPI0028A7842E|nr:TRAP transporter large permease [Paracoccus jeotgali]
MIAVALLIFLILIALSIPVAGAMGLLGVLLSKLYSFIPLTLAAGDVAWSTSTMFILLAIPLYIMMGEVLLRAGIAERMYNAMAAWLSWLPGGLMHSNFGFCGVFAATSGTSVATAATVGTVAIPQIEKHGYDKRFFLGSLAAGGTVGILIPPSTNMILYGILTETSIPKLYLAGFIPGALLVVMFMVTTLIVCRFVPSAKGRTVRYTWRERFAVLPAFIAPIAVFMLVVGSIYAGLATPAESGALGLAAALVLAAKNGQFNWVMLRDAMLGAMRTTAMSLALLVAAYFLNFVIGSIGLTRAINNLIVSLGLSPYYLLLMIVVFYFLLGMVMDTLTMMVATIPIIAPLVFAAGFDPVWFGVLMMILIEMAMITPPVGLNLFVIQGVRQEGEITDVMIGALPYVATMFAFIATIVLFPQIVTLVPSLLSD